MSDISHYEKDPDSDRAELPTTFMLPKDVIEQHRRQLADPKVVQDAINRCALRAAQNRRVDPAASDQV